MSLLVESASRPIGGCRVRCEISGEALKVPGFYCKLSAAFVRRVIVLQVSEAEHVGSCGEAQNPSTSHWNHNALSQANHVRKLIRRDLRNLPWVWLSALYLSNPCSQHDGLVAAATHRVRENNGDICARSIGTRERNVSTR